MPSTYEPIATQTLTSSAASVTFSSIPGTYTDLVLIHTNVGTGDNDVYGRVNGDTGANYGATTFIGYSTGRVSTQPSNETKIILIGRMGTSGSICITHFLNYSNTTTYKNILCRANNNPNYVLSAINTWRSTSAITQIELYPASGSFLADSTFTLYGIKAA